MKVLMAYTAMLVFDFAIFFGTAYLISEKDWSAWWLLLAVVICTGSNPRRILETAR
jgi:hypothetical protein